MELISGRTRSGLNPDAAPYVPAALRAVEDFSPEWWVLVQSSPWFADYWMRERFHESYEDEDEDADSDPFGFDDPELPDDINDALFSSPTPHLEEVKEEKVGGRREKWELISWGADKWKAWQGCAAEGAKYAEKAAKVVSARVSPRTIQQPR